MSLRINNEEKAVRALRALLPRTGVGLIAALALAIIGCVDDNTTESSLERSTEQCELENNQRAHHFYGNASGQYATTMTAGAALNIHTGCSADSTYQWQAPY